MKKSATKCGGSEADGKGDGGVEERRGYRWKKRTPGKLVVSLRALYLLPR